MFVTKRNYNVFEKNILNLKKYFEHEKIFDPENNILNLKKYF